MSVLIKGMDTPKGCAWCHFCEHGSINEFEFFCGLTNSRIGEMFDRTGWEDMRAADCPLIEVPSPHGRLIDAEITMYGKPLNHWQELSKAEAEGRLLVLPCKTVFEPTWDAGKDCDLVCPALFGGEECCGLCEKAALFVYERPCKQDDIDRIGKSVFLTREEAEAALKGEGK